MSQRIIPYELKRSAVKFSRHVGHSADVGRWPRLQRILFAILRRLKAEQFDEYVTYDRVLIDTDKVVDIVRRNRANVMELLGSDKAKFVVMGSHQFDEAIHSTTSSGIHGPTQFAFDAKLDIADRWRMYGLQVIVVPWIDGCFVLPDLKTKAPVQPIAI